MIVINGKEYRNIQEQVQKNMEDIEELQEQVDDGYYTKEESDTKFQTKADMSDYYDKTESDAKFQTKADMSDYYDKTESDAKFQTKIGMALYATQQQLNLNIAATEARTDLLLANKQDTLVSGTNIKTVNGNSLVGSGNINIDTSYTAGYGIGIANDVISIDQNTVATTNMLNVYIKDNDTNYTAIFRGEYAIVKGSGAYTSTTYADGSIGRSLPYGQPGYTYDLPNKSGTFALLDDIPATVSGVNNGTNWTSITIGSDTYGIPTGGSGSIVAGTGIDITNGVVSVDNTVAMKTDIPTISGGTGISVSNNVVSVDNTVAMKTDIPTISGGTGISVSNNVVSVDNTVAMKTDIPTISGGTGINVSNGVVSVDNTVAMKTDIPAQTKLYAHNISLDITYSGSNKIVGKASFVSTSSTQITTFTAFKNEVQTRGVVVASGVYTGSSSANNGRITCFSYGQGSYSQLCATVVYDYTDILDVVSVSSSTITDTVTQI